MSIATRAALRLALSVCMGLAGMSLCASTSRAAAPPEKVFPDSTFLFVKVNSASALRDSFRQSQFGQLWNDPGLKEWKQDMAQKLDEGNKSLKEKIGITLAQLVELPQGTAAMGVVPNDDPKTPMSLLLSIDCGKNAGTAADVLSKATKQAEDAGARIEELKSKGVTIHVIHPPKKDDDKDKPQPPLVWAQSGPNFTIGTDLDAVKDVLVNADGRNDSLASTETYAKTLKKCGTDSQVIWYIDANKVFKLMAQNGGARGNAAQAQQVEAIMQVVGINGLKAVGGSFSLSTGNYDSLSKTVFYAPPPVQGLLKVFSMPKVSLKPEPWVPANVAAYQTISWDLDNAFIAINDLANMFQPGILNVLEQQLIGPNGGEPLNFQKDLFGPIGDRITIISDYKKPIKEDSQRTLIAIALEDTKKFEKSFEKVRELMGNKPKEREFQGNKIFDFELPDLPNPNGEQAKFKGPISVTIAKNTLFASSDASLLEQILRGGGAGLADSSAFQSALKEMPEKVSSLSYVKPEESARVSYDMIKSGQFEKAMKGAAQAGGGPNVGNFGEVINKDKLPEFSVFAKYLSSGGGYSVSEEDGMVMTNFTLRKQKP